MCQAFFILLQGTDFLTLRLHFAGKFGVERLPFFHLLLQLGVTLFLCLLDFGEFRAALLRVGSQGAFLIERRMYLAHQIGAGLGNGRQVMQVARHLVGVVAVEQKLQRIWRATQVLLVKEVFELLLLLVQGVTERPRLLLEILEPCL